MKANHIGTLCTCALSLFRPVQIIRGLQLVLICALSCFSGESAAFSTSGGTSFDRCSPPGQYNYPSGCINSSAPYCSLNTSFFCCGLANSYACSYTNTSGQSIGYCSSVSNCSDRPCEAGQACPSCPTSNPYQSKNISTVCCPQVNQYICVSSSTGSQFCSSDSSCSSSSGGGSGGGSGGCTPGAYCSTCPSNAPYESANNSSICCSAANYYACKRGDGSEFCSASSSCNSSSGGGSGGCTPGAYCSTCPSNTPYQSANNTSICCAQANQTSCLSSTGSAYCSTSSSCSSTSGGGSGGGGSGGCTPGALCSYCPSYVSVNNIDVCCPKANEYACQHSDGSKFCSTSSSCSDSVSSSSSGGGGGIDLLTAFALFLTLVWLKAGSMFNLTNSIRQCLTKDSKK